MQTHKACRSGVCVIVLLCGGLWIGRGAAQDQNVTISQTTAHRPHVHHPLVGAMQTKMRPAGSLAAASARHGFAALRATGVPGFQLQSHRDKPAAEAMRRDVQMPMAARGPFAASAVGHGLPPNRKPLVAQSLGDAAPQATGSVPKPVVLSLAAEVGVAAAVGPEVVDVPSAEAALPTATPAAEASPASATPAAFESVAPAGTPAAAAAAPPPRTFADRLHMAVEAWAAAEIKGRDAAEIHKVRAAIAAFYALNDYAPLWLTDGKPNDAARAALARLAHAGEDGLAIAHLPIFATAASDDDLIAADIDLSDAVVAYGRQATGSRIAPDRIATLIGARPAIAQADDILASVAAAGSSAGIVLQDFNPPLAGYRALRDKLAELRSKVAPQVWRAIPAGPVLRVGMRDPRVPLIRSRFGLGAEADGHQLIYDTQVAAAVAEFQKASGLRPSGTLTARTIEALSEQAPPGHLEDDLIANMEMWRWMPREVNADRIEVNIPDFTVSVFRADQLVARNKVVVGAEKTPTPVFSNVMRFLIVNPVWNIPPSIIRKEFHDSPEALRQHGYEVSYRNGHIVAQQAPGERNALGRIKFMFPNDYAVYLHDTPARTLFGQSQRAFSHGCVRVDQPFDFAKAVMGPDSRWSEDRLKDLIGGGRERYVFLPEPLPIHIEYFTAFVDADGRLQVRKDIYGYAHKVDVALGLEKE